MMDHFKNIIGIAAVAGIAAVVIFFGERPLLSKFVQPLDGMNRTYWIDDFMVAALWGFWITVIAILFWYSLAAFGFGVRRWEDGNRRIAWGLIGGVAVLTCLAVGFFYTERTKTGGQWAWAFYLLNSAVLYYAATLFSSPAAFKYTAWGAKKVRRW